MNTGRQTKMEERASDRGMPFSVSMRHAFVPFTGQVTDDGFELVIAVGMVFKALIKRIMNKTQKNALFPPPFHSLVEPIFPFCIAGFVTVTHNCLHDLLCGKLRGRLLSILLKCYPLSLSTFL